MMDWAISQHRPTVLAHAAVSLSHAIAKEMMGNSMKVTHSDLVILCYFNCFHC